MNKDERISWHTGKIKHSEQMIGMYQGLSGDNSTEIGHHARLIAYHKSAVVIISRGDTYTASSDKNPPQKGMD